MTVHCGTTEASAFLGSKSERAGQEDGDKLTDGKLDKYTRTRTHTETETETKRDMERHREMKETQKERQRQRDKERELEKRAGRHKASSSECHQEHWSWTLNPERPCPQDSHSPLFYPGMQFYAEATPPLVATVGPFLQRGASARGFQETQSQ